MKKFNTAGLCVPDKHYMADISGKINMIAAMVDEGLQGRHVLFRN